MNESRKVLISGASIAGPALAYWLSRFGDKVTVIERSKNFQSGGQNVDIEGPGQQVIKMMGLEEKIEAKNTREKGVEFVGGSGKPYARLLKGAVGSLTSAYEILRGDLARILYDETKDDCDYRLGTSIAALSQQDDGVSVTFNDGSIERFDLVVSAEGIGSSTRRLVMEDDIRFRYLGVYASYFRIPKRPEDKDWSQIYHGKHGCFMVVRPGNDTDITVLVTFPRKQFDAREVVGVAQKAMLRDALQGAGGPADRILANLDHDPDFYLGPMSQVIGSTWSKGRFVLTGDAAWCPSAYTGQGTPLALIGAYILAGELKKQPTHTVAFESYERLMRPYLSSGRTISPGLIRLLHPKSRLGIGMVRTAERALASGFAQFVFRRFSSDVDQPFNLTASQNVG
ncbi:FAD-dependent monooxygenase [Sphingomonadaceae bacterium jetA1]|jgi:2-polyprenyl-6-methoxyphenol hydroxylase-like FAD-dependent oxidoreductase|uniref:FAD-dependent monooxygenase n=1 Tax=Facivitalis istanbulensis TaxID=3075838 RepID=UPI00348311E2